MTPAFYFSIIAEGEFVAASYAAMNAVHNITCVSDIEVSSFY